MAYLTDLPKCPCGKSATVKLQGRWNEPYGVFCAKCGLQKLKALEERQKDSPEITQKVKR